MSSRGRASLAWLAFAMISGFAPAARAQSEETALAREHFELGVRLIQQGRWADAVGELEAARAIHATPAVLYNLGVGLRGVGRFREAIDSFRAFLDALGPDGPAQRQAEVRALIDELSASLGRLRITTRPEAAAIVLDGERLPQGTREIMIDPGSHRVRAEARGYTPSDRDLEMERAGRATVDFVLAAIPTLGTLVVESATSGALVALDGSERGPTPFRMDLEPGTHQLAVTAPGHRTMERAVEISIGDLMQVQADLAPEESWVESPVLWIVLGVVVAGAVAGTTLGFALSGTEPPLQGDLGLVTGLLGGS